MATAEAPSASPPPEEDYIDMELTSSPSSNVFRYSIESPPAPARDFEFQIQMASFSGETEHTTSPADDLFYKGKLLPLHLPPRLQMVQNLLHSPKSQNPSIKKESFSENFPIPLIAIKAPSEFCNFSPTESCRPSCELNPDEFLLGFKEEMKGFVGDHPPRKSWSKKVKQLKQSSQAYFKALFGKSSVSSSCSSNKPCAKSAIHEESETLFANRGKNSGEFMKFAQRKTPFGKIDYNKWQEKEKIEEIYGRRSFSGAIQRISSSNNNNNNNKSSCSCSCSSSCSSGSSSFSFSSSNGFCDLQLLKRSISANTEIESSIEGAIAHCKQSQKLLEISRKNHQSESKSEICSLSVSKEELCRI